MKTIVNSLMNKKKVIYIIVSAVLFSLLLLGYIPQLASLSHLISPPIALFLGLLYAQVFGEAFPKFNKNASKYLLQYSVVGLGFGMNLQASLASGKEGMQFTIVSVIGTMIIGWLIGYKLLKINKNTSYLISSGTAICGGSAIAAIGPVINAKDSEMSVALGTVFILNAIALFIFPVIGHSLALTQQQFGTWAAIAIHDTSSVVGAGAAYDRYFPGGGSIALQTATTIKLTRALWIVPLALVTSFLFKNSSKKINLPWFIVFFIAVIIINTYLLQGIPTVTHYIAGFAQKCLTFTLFFIGASLTRKTLKNVGIKSLVQGVILWSIISVVTLLYVFNWVR
jgi:uncharacterized integral membrane protein (TIGR00698 family)